MKVKFSLVAYNFFIDLNLLFSDTWSTPHMAQAIARMAESGRAKVKEVCLRKTNMIICIYDNLNINITVINIIVFHTIFEV